MAPMRSRAIVALANVNERYVPDPASDVLTGLGTLLYLVSVFLGFDVLRRIRGLRAAIAVQQDRQNRCCSSLSWLRSWPAASRPAGNVGPGAATDGQGEFNSPPPARISSSVHRHQCDLASASEAGSTIADAAKLDSEGNLSKLKLYGDVLHGSNLRNNVLLCNGRVDIAHVNLASRHRCIARAAGAVESKGTPVSTRA